MFCEGNSVLLVLAHWIVLWKGVPMDEISRLSFSPRGPFLQGLDFDGSLFSEVYGIVNNLELNQWGFDTLLLN